MKNIVSIGWWALIIAIIGEIFVPIVLAQFYSGYNQTFIILSALGNPSSPVKVLYNTWMLVAGVLFLLSLPAFYSTYNLLSKPLTITIILFLAIFAIGACIFTFLFPVNESKEIITTASKIHGFGSAIGFMLLLFVPLLLGILLKRSNEKLIMSICFICFALALITFVLFIMSDKPEFSSIAFEGLWQRLNLLFMYLPLLCIAIKNILK